MSDLTLTHGGHAFVEPSRLEDFSESPCSYFPVLAK